MLRTKQRCGIVDTTTKLFPVNKIKIYKDKEKNNEWTNERYESYLGEKVRYRHLQSKEVG
jgi:hypothetical protein